HRLGGLAQGGAAAAPEIALHVTSSFDANGNFQTAVSRIADGRVQRAAPGIAQQGAARAAAMKQATKKGTF
uniref:hypothetical protein n=1 Tax=Oceanicella sp. SM1341 TaxID=1548889 RepID=UPI0013004E63